MLVMEYADSGTLRSYLKVNTNLTWINKYKFAYQIACAVLCLHKTNIVHRDLHSGNILIHQDNIKLADFGLSRRIDEVSRTHSTNPIVYGIIPYIDPEKLRKKRYSLNKASDIYSIGVLLWEISSGQPPFKDESYDLSLLLQISQEEYRETIVPNTPVDYSNLYTVARLKTILKDSNTKENVQINNDKLNPKLQVNDDRPNTSNSVHGELSHLINNFNVMDLRDKISPTTSMDVNENIFEEDLGIQHVIDYVNNHGSRELYNWLSNNQNSPNAIFLLGYFNYHGIEIKTDKRKAPQLYQKATKLKNSAAQHDLINIYIYEKDYKNHDKAFELSKELAEVGNSGGMNKLGCCYDKGIGTEKNIYKAFELYQKAANLGNCGSQYNVADMYIYGDGVEKDYDKAFEYSKKSARAEHSDGIRILGYCYDLGIETSIDKQQAFELYQKAAFLENKVAQYSLAMIYESGEETEKDINQAIHWYKKSAEQGYQDAKERLEKLKEI
ncbi:hypothetical protein RclHR1_02120010 [Rhizophagus clarus]|uniref:Protein kinase domain-containing protein n=1 Tax=Rhizophagus clarus TaxID=94130 RepID=A0A2Z6RLM4_9GLOM|nr:hypothetical protein RclHR1_02120010 [Rhizophagus clarus]